MSLFFSLYCLNDKKSIKFNKIKIIYWDNKEVEIDICNKLKQWLKKKLEEMKHLFKEN